MIAAGAPSIQQFRPAVQIPMSQDEFVAFRAFI